MLITYAGCLTETTMAEENKIRLHILGGMKAKSPLARIVLLVVSFYFLYLYRQEMIMVLV